MAQSDQTIQNATFPAVRADINDNLAALFSQSSGVSAPAVTTAFQPWIDTSTSPATWKIRNASNSNWITIGTLGTTFASGGVTPIVNGGTGQTTANDALNALLPSQTGNANKALVSDGTNVNWSTVATGQKFYYTSNTTWTKPSTGVAALVTLWGGGAGGFKSGSTSGSGGGGGCCTQILLQLSDLPSTATVTIGAGGAADTVGGTTSFVGTGVALYAYGGGRGLEDGSNVLGGGGGGSISAGNFNVGGSGHGLLFTGGSCLTVADGGSGAFSGGAGGAANKTGGSSSYGGGGGGGTSSGGSKSGGVSLYGGNGGAGGSSGTAGSFPGGGGGGARTGTPGAGGNGAAVIYVW